VAAVFPSSLPFSVVANSHSDIAAVFPVTSRYLPVAAVLLPLFLLRLIATPTRKGNPTLSSPSLESRRSLRPSSNLLLERLLAAKMAMSAATGGGYSRRDFPNTLRLSQTRLS
jgi:hypothetical protein